MTKVIDFTAYRRAKESRVSRVGDPSSNTAVALKADTRLEEGMENVLRNPLFVTDDTLYLIREKLAGEIRSFRPEYLMMPVTKDLDPFWAGLGVETSWFNALYPPYTILFMMLRDYPREFVQMVDGSLVTFEREYNQILDEYNHLYIRAIEHRGGGEPHGTLSLDEAMRLATLFYLLLKTSLRTQGIVFDAMGNIKNEWCGEPKIIGMNYRSAQCYADMLGTCFFAGIDWKQFMFRARGSLPELARTSWIINITDIDILEESNPWGFSFQNFIEMLDFCSVLKPELNQVFIAMGKGREIEELLPKFMQYTSMNLIEDYGTHTMLLTNQSLKPQ